MYIRILNKLGIHKFKDFIQKLKEDINIKKPNLNIKQYSEEYIPQIEINSEKNFITRKEMGKYLTDCFEKKHINRADIIDINGLWSWLAYFWFDQICPIRNGNIDIHEIARYICSSDYRDYYRHLVASTYDIYSIHRSKNSKIFLYSLVDKSNDFIEQFASRQDIISNANIIVVANQLYWNPERDKPKKGSESKRRPGNIRRFIKTIRQLELTYDIYSMNSSDILAILPEEFNNWEM